MSGSEVRPGAGWTLGLVCLAAVLMTIDITIVNVALPEITDDLSAGLDGLQWVINGYSLAFAALLLTAGSLSDRVGRRTIFIVGVGVFTAASVACGFAPGSGALTAFRVVQGAGAALVMATALALIAAVYPAGPRRQTAIGMFSAAGGAAAGLGPLVGGAVVDSLGWRWIFWINLPVGVMILVGALTRLREPAEVTRVGRGIDWPGVALAIALLFGLNYGLLTGPAEGWGSPGVVVALVGGAVLLVVFLAVERGRQGAMLDLALFRIPSFSGAILLTFFARVVSFGILPYLILWLQGMLGHSPLETGLRLTAMTLPILVVAPLAGKLQQYVSAGRLMAVGFGVVGSGFLLMARVEADSSWTVMFPGLVLLGVGGALTFPPLIGVAIGVVPPSRAGMASGLSNTFFPLGTAAGVAVLGALFTARVGDGLTDSRVGENGEQVRLAVTSGQFGGLSGEVEGMARTAFADALAGTCIAAAVVAFTASLTALLLIRARDEYQAEPGLSEAVASEVK